MTAELNTTLDNFIAKTAKSKVAVIIPLFGYWRTIQDNPLGVETLKIALDKVASSTHSLLTFFVGSEKLVPDDVANYLVGRMQAGNAQGVDVAADAGYAQYVQDGLRVARETTDATYFIVINPWIVIQRYGIDSLIDRLNLADGAKLVSGYDLHKTIANESFDLIEFERFMVQTPKEERDIDINFFGMARYALESVKMDSNIRTAHYLKWDIAQSLYSIGFDVITSQRIPTFVFDVNIMDIESQSDVEADKNYFQKKWGFLPA